MTPQEWESEFGDHTECPVCGTDCFVMATQMYSAVSVERLIAAARAAYASLCAHTSDGTTRTMLADALAALEREKYGH